MTDLAKASASPIDYTLPDGNKVSLHPISLRGWGRIERWMRETVLNAAKESLKDRSLTELQMRVIMRAAHAQASSISLANRDALGGLLMSFDGMLNILATSLRMGGMKADEDSVAEMVDNSMEVLSDMAEKVLDASFPDTAAKNTLMDSDSKN